MSSEQRKVLSTNFLKKISLPGVFSQVWWKTGYSYSYSTTCTSLAEMFRISWQK